MGKIKKAPGPKQEATQSPALAAFVHGATSCPLHKLPAHLSTFPPRWPFPRGDLYHWIAVLDRFDNILELFVAEYGLKDGPQATPFGCGLLLKGDELVPKPDTSDLGSLDSDGDLILVESVLKFSRYLLNNCSNRSLYSSSAHLNDLLNTTSLTLLLYTLQILLQLAQRYNALRSRSHALGQPSPASLLAHHYNVSLDRIRKMTNSFSKIASTEAGSSPSTRVENPPDASADGQPSSHQISSHDLITFSTCEATQSDEKARNLSSLAHDSNALILRDFGAVKTAYWRSDSADGTEEGIKTSGSTGLNGTALSPTSPSPSRPEGPRSPSVATPSRLAHVEPSPSSPVAPDPATRTATTTPSGLIAVNVSSSELQQGNLATTVKEKMIGLSKSAQYDLLHRIRVASALNSSTKDRQLIVGIRILALANLSYVHSEGTFSGEILLADSDESRSNQLVWQFAELVGPPKKGATVAVPRWLQAVAFSAIEALGRYKSRLGAVCSSLNVTANHGTLIYVIRKAVADLSKNSSESVELEEDEWREALFSLLTWLPTGMRVGDALVTAGLLPIMAEAMELKTPKAERYLPKIVQFLDTFVYNIREAFQELANARGLDIISELTSYKAKKALEKVAAGDVMPIEQRNKVIDYQLPFVDQQTLRWLLKFMNHLMAHSGGTFDRLLRNLIDSAPLLQALKNIIQNGPIFGSTIWGGAVCILTAFINNEPTSYAIIAEAGLSQALLESISLKPIVESKDKAPEVEQSASDGSAISNADSAASTESVGARTDETPNEQATPDLSKLVPRDPDAKLARGILPAIDAIATVPSAFGAICLNNNGLSLFRDSNALESFFEIFESPEHVKCLVTESDLAGTLGTQFDELIRHHPQLRQSVLRAVLVMSARVATLLQNKALNEYVGAKLWYPSGDDKIAACGNLDSVRGRSPKWSLGHSMEVEPDLEMEDVDDNESRIYYTMCEDSSDQSSSASVSTFVEAVSKFFAGFFSNQSLVGPCVEGGGFEYLLDLAVLPSAPYDFNGRNASRTLAGVIHMLVEQKPHLTLPSVMKKAIVAADKLAPFRNHSGDQAFFQTLTDERQEDKVHISSEAPNVYAALKENGTDFVKALVEVHTLTTVLTDAFGASLYNHRATFNLFQHVNLTDYYTKLTTALCEIQARCVWEHRLLLDRMSKSWIDATMFHEYNIGSESTNSLLGFLAAEMERPIPSVNRPTTSANLDETVSADPATLTHEAAQTTAAGKVTASGGYLASAEFLNCKTLRFLLSKLPTAIPPFLRAMAKVIVVKRPEGQQRQNSNAISDSIAKGLISMLEFGYVRLGHFEKIGFEHLRQMISSVYQCLIDDISIVDLQNPLCMILVLQSFKNQNGFSIIKQLLSIFTLKIASETSIDKDDVDAKDSLLSIVRDGVKTILDLFSHIVKARCIVESQQSTIMAAGHRERDRADHFSANQFLVDLRMTILPAVQTLWESNFLETSSTQFAKSVIDILKTILESDSEVGAAKRSDRLSPKPKQAFKPWKLPSDQLTRLRQEDLVEKEIAKEALFRCYNNYPNAQEYCRAVRDQKQFTRNAIPLHELEKISAPKQSSSNSAPVPGPSSSRPSPDHNVVLPPMIHPEGAATPSGASAPTLPHIADFMIPMGLNNMGMFTNINGMATTDAVDPDVANQDLLSMNIDPTEITGVNNAASSANPGGDVDTPIDTPETSSTPNNAAALSEEKIVTIDDLDEERSKVRDHLIEETLNVLNVHSDVTFELSDLILTSVKKVDNSTAVQQDIGVTLIQSLLSLQLEDDFRPAGKKIASYAHLLGLVIRNDSFYNACGKDLREHFDNLVGFIRKFPSDTADEGSPWIAPILLILEKLLAEDASPDDIKWTAPSADEDPFPIADPILQNVGIKIPDNEKSVLFDAIVDISHLLGKDEPLAHSVARVLVMLTRSRPLALRLGERKNLQRLFVMVKGLAGLMSDKLQSAVMIILRHIVEDEDTVRQLIRSEIKAFFDQRASDIDMRSSNRPPDTTSYLRILTPVIIRAPSLFVEVTEEMVKLTKYDTVQRQQTLALKNPEEPEPGSDSNQTPPEASSDPKGKKPVVSSPSEDTKMTVEPDAETTPGADKGKGAELRPPMVQNADGVINYLLRELLSYKEVGDSEPKSAPSLSTPKGNEAAEDSTEVSMFGEIASTPEADKVTDLKPAKPVFKADQHPIYIYRCFILQCLNELLSSYNRTKIEFINFSSKRNVVQSNTPSKPRSSVLGYLLHELIPVGTLDHPEDIPSRKRQATSNAAVQTIMALCAKTGEHSYERNVPALEAEEEAALMYVRKFVLEVSLKAYKEAGASLESLGVKYARMLGISDLFERLLIGKNHSRTHSVTDTQYTSQKQVAKLMFEKGFIAALSASVADIDLSFPNAKRAVKYILRPIKSLTDVGLELSRYMDTPLVPGQVELDEFSATSSVSGLADDREETPDLFRNSTLGMLDPGHEASSSSESDDDDEMDEMYNGVLYEGEIDYEDEDDEDVMSDADMDDVGPIEGLSGDVAMDVELVVEGVDDEDDEDDDEESDDSDDSDSSDSDELLEDQMEDIAAGEARGAPFSDDGDEEQGWTDEGDEDEGDIDMEASNVLGGPAEAIGSLLESMVHNGIHANDIVGSEQPYDDMMDEDDDEEDEEEDEMDEDDLMYDHAYDDEDDPTGPPWEWDVPEFAPMGGSSRRVNGHHHHHHYHHHRHPNPWQVFPGSRTDPSMLLRRYGHPHQGSMLPRQAVDDGTNPLLQRTAPNLPEPNLVVGGRALPTDLVDAMTHLGAQHGDSPHNLVSSLINAITQGTPGAGLQSRDALRRRLAEGPGGLYAPDLDAMFGHNRVHIEAPRTTRDDPNQAVNFLTGATLQRWMQETMILYGSDPAPKVHCVLNALLRLLAPSAIAEARETELRQAEQARQLKVAKELADRQKKEQDEKEAKEAKEKAEAQEKISREMAEMEEAARVRRVAAEAEASSAAAAAVADAEVQAAIAEMHAEQEFPNQEVADPETLDGEPMEAVESTPAAGDQSPAAEEDAGPSNSNDPSPAQVFVSFHGQQIDITNLQIDPGYLDALPEEMREEVLLGQIAEARSNAANTGQATSELDQEFLDALPPDIRDELVEQEMADRRRRDREQAQRNRPQGTTAEASAAEEMDTASFLASLEPSLRQAVLMDQDEEILSQLPPAIAAEARALGSSDRRLRQLVGAAGGAARLSHVRGWNRDEIPTPHLMRKTQRKGTVQMLDKAGVATLLRLMFVSHQGSAKGTLHAILQNVCQNRLNRSEVVSLLLSILQDGTADMSAVERSFNKLSLRAQQPPAGKEQPSTEKPTLQASYPLSEMTPLMVVQQCLAALANLTEANPSTMAQFFLTEHEASAVLKRTNRKGKAKENRASRFPINSLLVLLDRKLILESATAMETLSRLLNSLTAFVYGFLRAKDEGKSKGKEKEGEAPATTEPPPAESTNTAPETADGQPSTATEAAPLAAEGTSQSLILPDAPAVAEMETTSPQESKDNPDEPDSKDEKKKKNVFVPPYIPDQNLSLMVNILTARECNHKTFQDALNTTMHLSPIPGAKRVFGSELARQAQALGTEALADLDDLANQIKEVKSDGDIQNITLSKFSPASAGQAKLLRVLTAIDYIFDSKRKDSKTGNVEENLAGPVDSTQDGNVNMVYEPATFGALWAKLGDCLAGIRKHKDMLNVATILLPLVESLMLVCKNTSVKDAAPGVSKKEFEISSPQPEDRMESLFFAFTEEHRKVLNDLVRANPKLMSGTFSLLVKNPKVLEFDNKRSYFTRRLHSRSAEARHPQPPLQLSIRREFIFLDSFKHLYYKTPMETKYGKLNIRFHGEEGVDAGGVTREWFQSLARQMFNPGYALFTPVASDRTTFHPNRLSAVNDQHLMFFKFIGRVIGKALYENRVLDCHFSRALYKRILGRAVSIKDMETLDLDYSKSLQWMLENNITDIITETFSIESDDFGEHKVIELIENGASIAVTEENKHQYVQLVVEYRLTGSVDKQLEQFLSGFHDIVPAELISIFNEQELELLISGLPDIDVDDWKNNTEYHGYSAASSQIQWFWRALKSFDKEERAKLLQFVTGTSKVPLNGFKELEGMNGVSRFNIHRDYGSKDRLPSSHTCFNQLDLPEYDSYEALRKHIILAITAGSDYFGFA